MLKAHLPIARLHEVLDRPLGWGDAVVSFVVCVMLYLGVRLATGAEAVIKGPEISLAPAALPLYAVRSLGRMVAAYVLSLAFTLLCGYVAAYNRRAEKVVLPLLDVLQSVPILSFLPVVVLSLSAVMPERLSAELASVVLIFTSQAWNMTFAWYQSLRTIPGDLREAATVFQFGGWRRFWTMELPFGAIPLLWNSIMSWAGGWFFLMAAEMFTVGERDFRLPGLGSYLQEAASQGNIPAVLSGLGCLTVVIIILDQLLWRPLLAWSVRFRLGDAGQEAEANSWFYDALRHSRLVEMVLGALRQFRRWGEDLAGGRSRPVRVSGTPPISSSTLWHLVRIPVGAVATAVFAYEGYRALGMLLTVPLGQWRAILVGLAATCARVFVALGIALAWTLPAGILMGIRPRVRAVAQPLAQIAASIPATALFPAVLLLLLRLPGGLNVAAVLLMLMGTQWYLLFNAIAGASAIPVDLRHTVLLLPFSRPQRWRLLFLPALFPYLVTGGLTAAGGAWNASIVAEYVHFGGKVQSVTGLGALISRATATGDYPLLLASTLTMILTVSLLNRLLWRRLYRVAERRFRME
ncbi:MAG: ABC transporter permease subunit [Armatimonadetes bacterium]|nr:ABC transporter permease subunit [Armatimonadota bacterium]